MLHYFIFSFDYKRKVQLSYTCISRVVKVNLHV
jgi:hypothetical protein